MDLRVAGGCAITFWVGDLFRPSGRGGHGDDRWEWELRRGTLLGFRAFRSLNTPLSYHRPPEEP